jgi:hypothetical protein
MKLIYCATNQEVKVGDLTNFGTITDIVKPHKPASTGRVYITFDPDKPESTREYFPGVIDAVWIEREDRS